MMIRTPSNCKCAKCGKLITEPTAASVIVDGKPVVVHVDCA